MKDVYEILIIEEDKQLAKQIKTWLANLAKVKHVTAYSKAKELLGKNHWSMIIIDFNTCDSNCLEIIQVAKNADPNVLVLIIAHNIKVEFIVNAMESHADSLLFKPLNEKKFISQVACLIEQSKLKKNKKIILAIGAHPDDVELGCGGTLVKLQYEGHDLHIMTLSLGEFGGEWKLRKKEAQLAAKYLHATLYLGNFIDTKIYSEIESILFIEEIIKKIQPTQVYTHSFYDTHQDHKNIYQATITACRQTSTILTYQSPSTTSDFHPNIFVNINDFIEKKIELLSIFKSQSHIRPYLKPDMIRATARYWGRFSNYQLVEPMQIIKGNS